MPPFDGNGNYSLPTNSFAQPVTGTTIDDSDAASLWADLSTALSTCVVNNQTSSPSLLNPKILTTILDTNGNELVDFATTGSAVNNVRITNAATGDAAKIDVTESNTNLDLEGNGTGFIRTNSQRVYGMVVEDDAQQLLSTTSTAARTTLDMSAAGGAAAAAVTAGAKVAMLSVFIIQNSTTATVASSVTVQIAPAGAGSGGKVASIGGGNNSGDTISNYGYTRFPVNLDSSGDFEYVITENNTSSFTAKIYFEGYYV